MKERMMTKDKKSTQRPQLRSHVVINRDGSLNIHRPRERGKLFSDLYHYFLSISWPKFFTIMILLFVVSNLFFAVLYFYAGPQALDGAHPELGFDRFVDSFF